MQESKYYLDLAAFTLGKLKNLLKNSRLLPSQQIFQEDIDQRFACLAQYGIENLLNEERGICRGKFALEDLKLWVKVVVQDVPQVIQYG